MRPSRPRPTPFGQRSFEDLGQPLDDVTFCVIDLETTGTSAEDEICEIGALRVRGGEVLGTFQTFVNPGRGIPPLITTLTGIGDVHVERSPRIDQVLPALLEFVGSAVVVGHNVGFDLGFLRRACERVDRAWPDTTVVDTLGLARRLVREEVPNCKLSTLAAYLCLGHRPSHRALDDVLATADLLHLLLERARGLGVTALDELIELPTAASHPMRSKLALTDRLPRTHGVYLFRDLRGSTLYVGKAVNLRQRVRSYFSSDDRKKVGPLLTRTARIDHRRTSGPLESEILELRLIQALRPEFNQHGVAPDTKFVVATSDRSSVTVTAKVPKATDLYLGPFGSRSAARSVADSLIECVAQSEMAAAGPGALAPVPPAVLLESAIRGSLDVATSRLEHRMRLAASAHQFERAARFRDHIAAIADARRRQQRLDLMRRAGNFVLAHEGLEYRFDRGVLTHLRSTLPDGQLALDEPWQPVEAAPPPPDADPAVPLPTELAEQILVSAKWWERSAETARLCFVEGVLANEVSDGALRTGSSAALASGRGRVRGDRHRVRAGNDLPGGGGRVGGHSAITRPASRSA